MAARELPNNIWRGVLLAYILITYPIQLSCLCGGDFRGVLFQIHDRFLCVRLNIKKWHKMCQEIYFIILVTAVRDRPTPEIRFLQEQLKVNSLAHAALRRFTLAVDRTSKLLFLRGGHSTIKLPPPQRNVRRQCLRARWCYDVQWRIAEEPMVREKKLALTIYTDFMQTLFTQILRGGVI